MKIKLIVTSILFAFVVLAVCSCSNSNSTETTDYLKYIYQIDSGEYDSDSEAFNRNNVISASAERFFDSDVLETKVVSINHKEYNLRYNESLHYPVGDEIVDLYLIEGNKDQKVLLNKDGSISAVLFTFETLDLPITASAKEIRPLLEKKLQNLIDLTAYQHVNVPVEKDDTKMEKYEMYTFLYYNSVDGYMTDYTRVSVSNGEAVWEVSGLSINNLGIDNLDFRIDKEKEQELLTAKLKDIYTTDTTEYKSYNEVFPSQVVMYEGEMYIMHYVSAKYIDSSLDERSSCISQILIHLHLINIDTK